MPRLNTTGRPSFNKVKYRQVTKEEYGESWPQLSEYVRKRDGYRCRADRIGLPRCGNYFPPPFSRLLHAHHIVPLPRGRNHPTNLVTLCKDCHSATHGGKNFGKKISDKQKLAAKRIRCT